MAEILSKVAFTEQDRVNCPFYWKIGACRHGEQCSRQHHRPTASQTILIRHMYSNPILAIAIAEGQDLPDQVAEQAYDHYEYFVKEIYVELGKFGIIEELICCDNVGDHMIGNVFIKYADEEMAADALKALNGRIFDGKPLVVEFSPVTDFREAHCRQFEEGKCPRGGYCNFMHGKHCPRVVFRRLRAQHREEHPEFYKKMEKRRSRSRSGGYSRERENIKRARETSAERRARIAAWNVDAENEN